MFRPILLLFILFGLPSAQMVVKEFAGRAEILVAGGNNWIAARAGDPILHNSRLRTSSDGKLEVADVRVSLGLNGQTQVRLAILAAPRNGGAQTQISDFTGGLSVTSVKPGGELLVACGRQFAKISGGVVNVLCRGGQDSLVVSNLSGKVEVGPAEGPWIPVTIGSSYFAGGPMGGRVAGTQDSATRIVRTGQSKAILLPILDSSDAGAHPVRWEPSSFLRSWLLARGAYRGGQEDSSSWIVQLKLRKFDLQRIENSRKLEIALGLDLRRAGAQSRAEEFSTSCTEVSTDSSALGVLSAIRLDPQSSLLKSGAMGECLARLSEFLLRTAEDPFMREGYAPGVGE